MDQTDCLALRDKIRNGCSFNMSLHPGMRDIGQYLDSVANNTTTTPSQKHMAFEAQVNALRRCWNLHFRYLTECVLQIQDDRRRYVTPLNRSSYVPLTVDFQSLENVYFYVMKCLNYMLDIQERMKEEAERELVEFKARPGGYTFQIMLQNRFIEKQRQLLDAYDAARDNNERQHVRRQLVAVDAQVKQKNDEIASLERQMRPLRHKIQIVKITEMEIERIAAQRQQAQDFFDRELFDVNIHAI